MKGLRWFKIPAFTLAEVLITLGIIGVVAALTVPNLMFKIKEIRTVKLVKQTQSILSNALRLAEDELGGVEGWTDNTQSSESATAIAENLRPFLKFTVDCGLIDSNNMCFGKGKYKLKNGNDNVVPYDTDNVRYKILLNNGVAVSWLVVHESDRLLGSSNIQFNIDINGSQTPNQMGIDTFMFEYYNSNIRPMGAPDSLYPYERFCKTKDSNGSGCAYQLIQQNNMSYLR